ncbi:MAG: tetrahydrofolate dehydrogenase/cyclohydrolase catalytic domain-containing protein, partial [Flavobacteriaceae bacterium]
MKLLEGKKTANRIKEEIKEQVAQLTSGGKRPPHLAAVLVGTDGASLTYVGSKVRSCDYVGF